MKALCPTSHFAGLIGLMTEFDDAIIHRIVNSIHVTKDLNLRIFIKGGAEIVEPLFPLDEE